MRDSTYRGREHRLQFAVRILDPTPCSSPEVCLAPMDRGEQRARIGASILDLSGRLQKRVLHIVCEADEPSCLCGVVPLSTNRINE